VAVVVMLVAAALWLAGEPRTGDVPAAVVALPAHDLGQDLDPPGDVPAQADDDRSEVPLPAPTSLLPDRPGAEGLAPRLRVMDSAGRPVPFAEVVVGARPEVLAVVSAPDLEAAARIHNVALLRADGAGRCVVPLRRADHAVFAWAPSLGTSAIWGASAMFDDPRDDFELTLQLPALLAGQVLASDNTPLAGAYVSFERQDGSTPDDSAAGQLRARLPAPLYSDAAGSFRAFVDAPQTLKVSAVHRGSPTSAVLVNVVPDGYHEAVLVKTEQ